MTATTAVSSTGHDEGIPVLRDLTQKLIRDRITANDSEAALERAIRSMVRGGASLDAIGAETGFPLDKIREIAAKPQDISGDLDSLQGIR